MPQGRLKDAVTVSEAVRSQGRRESLSASSRSRQNSRDSLRLRTATRSEEVLQRLPVGVVVIDRHYDILTINGVARRQFGIHNAAVGNDFIHLAHHYSATALRQAIDRAATGEMVAGIKIETSETPPDAKRTLEISCYSLPGNDDEDTDVLVAVVAEDVTDREQLSKSRDAAEANLRRLTAANEDVLAANQELTNMIARLRAETEDLLVGTEEVQAATEEVETLNEELQASNEELETLNEELQATVEELNTTNDDLQARTVELQEVAKRSDSALTRLEAILASISDAVFVVDDTGAVVLSNRAYKITFGGSGEPPKLEDDAGKPLPLEQSPQVLAARGEAFDISFTMSDGEGNRRWFEARAHPVPGDEGNLCVVVIRDITERSLRHLQDQWLAIASHELRTPLAALRAFLQLSTRGGPSQDSERARDYLDKAMDQTRRIESLVYQMLDASRFQHGQIALTRSTIDLVPLVQRACEVGQALTEDQTITFKSTQQHLLVDGDGPRLEQAILNLIKNALTHAKSSKTISVRLRRTQDQAEITVQDRGPGIPESELIEIFDRFKQGSGISAGLGLGLYIAREIVTGHGGAITVKSPPGKGTTFTVAIPLSENEPDKPNC
jgi:two-component system CheB/CheR fusion protein